MRSLLLMTHSPCFGQHPTICHPGLRRKALGEPSPLREGKEGEGHRRNLHLSPPYPLPRKREWNAVPHLCPSHFEISDAASPPTRACGRPPVVMASTNMISSARGASGTLAVTASKWLRT